MKDETTQEIKTKVKDSFRQASMRFRGEWMQLNKPNKVALAQDSPKSFIWGIVCYHYQ